MQCVQIVLELLISILCRIPLSFDVAVLILLDLSLSCNFNRFILFFHIGLIEKCNLMFCMK